MKPSIETIEFHGLEALRLNGPKGSSAIVSKLGGQLLSWVTPDGREHLFLSEKAVFDGSVAVRGGVPVCFPQFSDQGNLPKHGFVRTRPWSVTTERTGDDFALVTLDITDDAETRALWPHAFLAEITVMLEVDRVDIELCVTNTGGTPFDFTGALHTYLRMVQVEDVALEGLRGYEYRDALDNNRMVRETGTELTIDGAIDRVYRHVERPLMLKAANLSLAMQGQGFSDVVVWNPWVEKCAAMSDMLVDDWRRMLCVEVAQADNLVVLPAGEEWYGRQTLVSV